MKILSKSALLASAMLFMPFNAAFAATAEEVLNNYANIALASYQDSLATAKTLREAIEALVKSPSGETLAAARKAWVDARVPYQQTEAFRFGNPIVDEWEGKVNAWPLDEGLIDYVDASYGTESDENEYYVVNIIANSKITVGGEEIDASEITPRLLEAMHELGGVEANVTTGYHAIEFLLWGQDLNGTGPGAGNRPATDFDVNACTGGNCDRRIAYLQAAADLLIEDLEDIVTEWEQQGEARAELSANGAQDGLAVILTGMGSLSYGELAGERMKLGLLLNDPEEEHDCFSDNTHNSHYYDVVGISNVWHGTYVRVDGSKVEGPSLASLVAEKDEAAANELNGKIEATLAAFTTLKERAETVEAYDQMIGEGNTEGNAVVQAAIDTLIDQTRAIERVIASLDLGDIELEGSDSLDNPDAVFE